MPLPQPNNPLHGITLKTIVQSLVDVYDREWLAEIIPVKCFLYRPTMPSSLVFLRKENRAREKVEDLYLQSIEDGLFPHPYDEIL